MANIISSSVWFVTGVGRGLGRCIAEEILRLGGKVAGTVRRREQVRDLLAEYGSDRLWIRELELSDAEAAARVFGEAVAQFGTVDVAVNNAAYSVLGAAEEVSLEDIRGILDTNLVGSIAVARAAVAHMRARGTGGRLVQVSSSAGQAGFGGLSLYCASKWGIEGFVEALSQEVAGFGIQTTLVEPGTIRTGFGSSGVVSEEMAAYRDTPSGRMRRMAESGYVAPGDPVKMARAIVATYEMANPPARLALGTDAYQYVKGALTARLAQLEASREVAFSTDYV